MFFKKIKLSLLTLALVPTLQVQAEMDAKDYAQTFEAAAKGAYFLFEAVNTAKNMSTEDLDRALHNTNNITWDLLVPAAAAIYAGTQYNTGSSTMTKVLTGTGSAVCGGLVAYILGSLPKSAINALISKATGLKHSLEEKLAV